LCTSKHLVIGTRRSKLAIKQTELVVEKLASLYPHMDISIKTIETKGDFFQAQPLYEIGGKGLFVKEIEQALLDGQIDMAVHSMKDVPTEIPSGLTIAAILRREDPRDAFVSFKVESLSRAQGLRIGTSSLRRKRQLELLFRQVEVVPLRGNVDTRLKRLKEGRVDGLILAYAGLKRLGYDRYVTELIPSHLLTPAPGQGAIGIETRQERQILELLSPLRDERAHEEVTLERRLQSLVGGGCHVPLGVNVVRDGTYYEISLFLSRNGRDFRINERFEAKDLELFLQRIVKRLGGREE